MCSAARLWALLDDADLLEEPRKLQTAMYLAQERSTCFTYRYRLQKGRVLSDELDQDFSQLSGSGALMYRYDAERNRTEVVIFPLAEASNKLSTSEKALRAALKALLGTTAGPLEAAATLRYAKGSVSPDLATRLRWIQSLDPTVREEAEALAAV